MCTLADPPSSACGPKRVVRPERPSPFGGRRPGSPRLKKTPAAAHPLPQGGEGRGSVGLFSRIRWIRSLKLVLILLAAASAAPAAEVADCHLVAGWEQQGRARRFTADNLFEYIDGNAEGYLLYGFVQMRGVTCKSGGESILVDVFEMTDADSAYGVFTANLDPHLPIEKVGMGGQITPRRALFCKGKYYVELAAHSQKGQAAALRAFAREAENRIPGRATPPAELSWFPTEKLASVRLIPESVLGLRLLKRGFVAHYDEGQAFVVIEQSPQSAAAVLSQLRQRFGEAAPAQVADEAFQADDQYLGGMCIFRKGRPRRVRQYAGRERGYDTSRFALRTYTGNVERSDQFTVGSRKLRVSFHSVAPNVGRFDLRGSGARMAVMILAWRIRLCLAFLLLLIWGAGGGLGQVEPEETVFQSGGLQLHGFIWKPSGSGPFPAILWNHGSEKRPGSQPPLAKFYTEHGYVFFVPHRSGQGRSPGEYIQDLVAQAPPSERGRRMIELQDERVADVVTALDFLKSQPFVDPGRISISGCSYGGIQTLLAGERNLGVKALVPFAPGAMAWEGNPYVSDRLLQAVDHAKAPIFLLQAKNDYSLGPSHALSKEANKKHKDFQSKIYPAFGSTHQDGHWGFCTAATDVWGNDVLAFLEAQMKNGK